MLLWLLAMMQPALAAESYTFHFWSELTAEQQAALAPVAADWNNFPATQQGRLLKVAKGYNKLNLDQRRRVHARLQAWARMTPEQRYVARQNYKKLIELPVRKQAQIKQHWIQVQSADTAKAAAAVDETAADETP